MSSQFNHLIKEFNAMYKIGAPEQPTITGGLAKRLEMFKKVLTDEVNEVDEIIELLESQDGGDDQHAMLLNAMTMLADWCGDVVVYAWSEGVRHGIPMDDVLNIIMESNASKLGVDGKPMYSADGAKVMKGPNYWKPEPKIRALLTTRLNPLR